jgi:hydroxymethylbilane synthase
VRERLEPKDFCPAAGQGSLGIEIRKGDTATFEALRFLDDEATHFAVTVERAALAALGGGCQVPIGVHCRPTREGVVELFAVVAAPETGAAVRVYFKESVDSVDPTELGRTVAQKLIEAGAGPLLEAVSGVSK